MTQPIDVVYVELRATGEEDAARDVRDAVRDIERSVDRTSRQIERDLDDAFRGVGRAVDDTVDDVKARVGELPASFAGVQAELDKTTKKIRELAVEFNRTGDRGLVEQIGNLRGVQRELDGVRKLLGDTDKEVRGGLIQSLSQVGGVLRNISVLLPSPFVALIAAAVPAAIALGGALLDLSKIAFALPAGIAVVVAAFASLKIAFSGVGDAVEALASGDLKKIREAMANLSPSARAFAREINGLRTEFSKLRKTVQEAFFAEIRGDLTELARKTFPTLRNGMEFVSSGFGQMFSSILKILGLKKNVDTFMAVFETTGDIITGLTPSISGFVQTILDMVREGLPFIRQMATGFGEMLKGFSSFIGGKIKSGEFKQFLQDGVDTLRELGGLLKAVGRLIGSLFGNAGDEGRGFLQTLTDLTNRMAAFFESAEGQRVIQQLLDSIPPTLQLLAALGTAIAVVAVYLADMQDAVEAVGGGLLTAGVAVGNFFSTLWGWVQTAGSAVATFFTSIGNFFVMLGSQIASGWAAVTGFFSSVIAWFSQLPSRIWVFVSQIPTLIGNAFRQAFNTAFFLIGFGIGTIIKFFATLPGRVLGAIKAVIGFISNTFTSARNVAVNLAVAAVNGVVSFFRQLPGRVLGAIRAVIGFVSSTFSSARSRAVSLASSLVSGVVNFFRQLPGRAGSAVSSMRSRVIGILQGMISSGFNAGRAIINGIARGISSGVGFVISLARQAAARIIQGLKSALGIGSPSKVAALEVGRPVAQGIGVGIQDDSTQVRRAIDAVLRGVSVRGNAEGRGGDAGIVFGEGAVQVTFQGVVPTVAEARRTGVQIGAGIAQVLRERAVRTAVRTV